MSFQERFDGWFAGGARLEQQQPVEGPSHYIAAVHVVTEDPLVIYMLDVDVDGISFRFDDCRVSDKDYEAKKFVYLQPDGSRRDEVWRLRGDVPQHPDLFDQAVECRGFYRATAV